MDFFNLILGISYNIPNMLSSTFQSHSIEIEDFEINLINPFNPISNKGGRGHFQLSTRNVLFSAQDVKIQISES